MSPRVLVVTAAFGEGHNTAAQNLALALHAAGAQARVADPCLLGAPLATRVVAAAYRLITTHFPRLWERVYNHTDDIDFSRQRSFMLGFPERSLADLIRDFQPQAVVSCYPLYPYLLERLLPPLPGPRPLRFTVVTDSVNINTAWTRGPADGWLVADARTRQSVIDAGIPAHAVVETGFPVHPRFARLVPLSSAAACAPFRVLYFPTTKLPHIRRFSRAILEAAPQVHLSIVMGKNVRSLGKRALEIREEYPGRVRLHGWTRRVPQLLATHHLAVGKAGGATVHEAIAARCPMLVNHLVPGQEEGNLELLRLIGGGELCPGLEDINAKIRSLLEDGAADWRLMKQALARHDHSTGAAMAAHHILREIASTF